MYENPVIGSEVVRDGGKEQIHAYRLHFFIKYRK
jgi:hypothetical protein